MLHVNLNIVEILCRLFHLHFLHTIFVTAMQEPRAGFLHLLQLCKVLFRFARVQLILHYCLTFGASTTSSSLVKSSWELLFPPMSSLSCNSVTSCNKKARRNIFNPVASLYTIHELIPAKSKTFGHLV